ncbi:MAG TPA: hypothetical protein VK348_03510 [Planctomycetota bacterium]|nr:hypothetical protein [Planctomycetota bacterium]
MLRLAVITTAFAAALGAQITTTAYAQDSTRGNAGNFVPLGRLSTGLFAEGRSQILIPPQFLPVVNSMLVGIAASGSDSAHAPATITYASLKITVSPTTATSLSATFANNLPAPSVLLDVANLTLSYQSDSWTVIPFTTGFVYDGTSALVIDIQKVANAPADVTHVTVQSSNRTDLPRMINALGTAGSGAHLATTATVTTNFPLSMQLRWNGLFGTTVPTLKLKSDNLGNGNQFALGRTIDVTVQGAPGAVYVNQEGLSLFNPPHALPPVVGRYWVNGITLNVGTLPASGQSTLTQPIPANPALVGLHLVYQSLVAEGAALRFTNAADCILQS